MYKLVEIQQKHRLLRAGQRVVDLGCWPGGWLQCAAAEVGASGRVVGIDRAAVAPPLALPNVVALEGDLAEAATAARLSEALGGLADVVLSDAAPKLTGIRDRDRVAEEDLLCAVEKLLPELLRPGGDLLLKILEGPEAQQVERRIRRLFARAGTVKVRATRKGSSERFLLARNFRGAAGSRRSPAPG